MMNRTAIATALAVATAFGTPAHAETVLRLDEVAVGELDPAKASELRRLDP